MFDIKKFLEAAEAFKKAYVIRKQHLGLAVDQTFLNRYISCKETKIHKKMKEIVISHLISNGVKHENIMIEKRPLKTGKFKPDITLKSKEGCVFFECHYHDNWARELPTHIYNNISSVRNFAKIIICMEKLNKRKDSKTYVKTHKILSQADEVWLLNLEENKVEEIILPQKLV